jgi:pseudouridine kinase
VAPRVICFGAAHVDIQARAHDEMVAGTSNPVRVTRRHGGVARNVAVWLAALGCETSLVTRLGRDRDGDDVLAELTALGIETAGISRSETTTTASYTAALDPGGELHIGLADMAIYDEITATGIDTALKELGDADAWFLDTNPPEFAITHLSYRIPGKTLFAADTVSRAKAPRLRPALARLNILVTNEAEAFSIVDPATPRDRTSEAAAKTLRAGGIEHVVIGQGADGVLYLDESTLATHRSTATRVIDVTGAGDALAAGLLFAMLSKRSSGDAIKIALAAAASAVESATPVPAGISRRALFDRAGIRL